MATSTALAPYQNQAALSRSNYISRLDAFDPMAYFRQASGAGIADALEAYGTNDAARRNGLSASGFSPAGPGGTGVINRDLNDRVARAIAANAVQAGQLESDRIGGYGSVYSQDSTNLAGERDREQAEENAKRQEHSSILGSLFGAAGTLGGAFLGGPGGAKLGSSLGGAIGKLFGR